MTPIADDYIGVDERIQRFYERFPDGSLQTWHEPQLFHVGERTFLAYAAAAYRTPDDTRPGIGWAWEPVPGPTPFTRDSELQNAETSAWGRAIAAIGFEVRQGIATREDVQKSQAAAEANGGDEMITQAQHRKIGVLIKELNEKAPAQEGQQDWIQESRRLGGVSSRAELTKDKASEVIEALQKHLDAVEVPF